MAGSGDREGVSGETLRIGLRLSDDDVSRIAEGVVALLRRDAGRRGVESPYLTIEEAAVYLRCRRQRIDDLLSQRRLSRIKEGSRTLILREEIDAYLKREPGRSLPTVWESAA